MHTVNGLEVRKMLEGRTGARFLGKTPTDIPMVLGGRLAQLRLLQSFNRIIILSMGAKKVLLWMTPWLWVRFRVTVWRIRLTFTSVNGQPKPYSQVTEEDHELMTPEEYTAYFEVMQAQSAY